ncbi:MAG: molybdopterin molybdotransferase MoeA [Planctomycetota bacterium]
MASPGEAVDAMVARAGAVATERVAIDRCVGRMLAEPILAERDSPAADVSAMDGYAVRRAELAGCVEGSCAMPVGFEVETGSSPAALPAGVAARVFTGGVIPQGADTVIRREDVRESEDSIVLDRLETLPDKGTYIRRRGENLARGARVVEAGRDLGPTQIAAARSVSLASEVVVHKKVRVAILVTGNEVQAAEPRPYGEADARVWDSNGPGLASLVGAVGWAEPVWIDRVGDSEAQTRAAIERGVRDADVLVTTGGVSMGDHDVVPRTLVGLGGEAVYHHLSMRPGKPNLGAIMPDATPVVSLPGNPVSAMVGGVVLLGPVLRRLAGCPEVAFRPRVSVRLREGAGPDRPLSLWRYLPAVIDRQGRAIPVEQRGSGDAPALGRSEGLIEVPPGEEADASRRPWLRWTLGI